MELSTGTCSVQSDEETRWFERISFPPQGETNRGAVSNRAPPKPRKAAEPVESCGFGSQLRYSDPGESLRFPKTRVSSSENGGNFPVHWMVLRTEKMCAIFTERPETEGWAPWCLQWQAG